MGMELVGRKHSVILLFNPTNSTLSNASLAIRRVPTPSIIVKNICFDFLELYNELGKVIFLAHYH